MARRRKTSVFEDIYSIAAMLPWWMGVALAIVAYFVFSHFASQPAAINVNPQEIGGSVAAGLVRALAGFLQYIVPGFLLLGSAASALGTRRRRNLMAAASAPDGASAIHRMSWQEFEMLIDAAFRAQGFQTYSTPTGPDGGVDLVLRRDRERHLVQCKHWRARKVGVSVVRELYGVMAAEGAVGGYVVTSGNFTNEAREFANGRNVELVDGETLERWFRPLKDQKAASGTPASTDAAACPRCGAEMVKRIAKRGVQAGSSFWGCSRYPACRGTRPA